MFLDFIVYAFEFSTEQSTDTIKNLHMSLLTASSPRYIAASETRKCEVIEKNSHGASERRCQTVFVLRCCMSRGRSLNGK